MKEEKLLGNDPLTESEALLRDDFYGKSPRRNARGTEPPPVRADKPTHYKVICISMYTKDLEELDQKVAQLKTRGWTKANKSQLIRLALAQLDMDKLVTPPQ